MAHNEQWTFCNRPSGGDLGFFEVARVVDSPSLSLGQMCQYANKWAKYKPVRYPYEAHDTGWWQTGGTCGMAVTNFENLSDIVAAFRGGNLLPWDYLKPRGPLSSEPLRLLDYEGYFKLAIMPAPTLLADTISEVVNNETTTDFTQPNFDLTYEAYNLHLSDFWLSDGMQDISLDDFYFGVLLVNVEEPTKFCVGTSQQTIGSYAGPGGRYQVQFYGAESVLRQKAFTQCRAYAFLSSERLTGPYNQSTQGDISGVFVSACGQGIKYPYLHRFGKYDFEVEDNTIWRTSDPYVRGSVFLMLAEEPYMDLTVHNVRAEVCSQEDIDLYNNNTITAAQLLDRSLNGVYIGTLNLIEDSEGSEAEFSVNIYIPEATPDEEGLDPAKQYRIVVTTDESAEPVIISTTRIRIQ